MFSVGVGFVALTLGVDLESDRCMIGSVNLGGGEIGFGDLTL